MHCIHQRFFRNFIQLIHHAEINIEQYDHHSWQTNCLDGDQHGRIRVQHVVLVLPVGSEHWFRGLLLGYVEYPLA